MSTANKTVQGTAYYNGDKISIIDVIQNYKGENEYLIIIGNEPTWVKGDCLYGLVWLV